MALFRRGFPKVVIIHSDRVSKYCSHAYRDLDAEHHLRLSMSRKGNCWDNAVAESFFHSLKVEAIQYEPIMTRDEMRPRYNSLLVPKNWEKDFQKFTKITLSNGYRKK